MDKIFSKYGIEFFGVLEMPPLDKLLKTRNAESITEDYKRIIPFLVPYYSKNLEGKRNLSYYACLPDYHKVIENMGEKIVGELKERYPDDKFLVFTDNSPFDERILADKAGFGKRGKNGLILNKKYGSRFFLAEIVTTAEMPLKMSEAEDICINCGACVRACPVDAIFDKSKCLSRISQKKQWSDEEEESFKKAKYVWGCDICQDVCPVNKNIAQTEIPEFLNDICKIITKENASELIKTRPFSWRGLEYMLRNIEFIDTHSKGE